MSQFAGLTERSVMSGLGFFVDDRLVVAVLDDRLCLHIDALGEPEDIAALSELGAIPFEVAGRPVRGWYCIPEASLDEAGLAIWVARGVAGLGLPM